MNHPESNKAMMLIIDGLGDLPIPEFGGRTPLEAAFTPNLDLLASAGHFGQVDPVAPGVIPNTDSGTGMLLGLEPDDASRLKRGPIEAAGAGCRLENGAIALRANFATAESRGDELWISDRRAGRIAKGLQALVSAVDNMDLGHGVTAQLFPTEQHRGVLVLTGPGLSEHVSDTDPGDLELPACLPPSEAQAVGAEFAADCINRFIRRSFDLLQSHPVNLQRIADRKMPANVIITRGAGAGLQLHNRVMGKGLSAAVISGCNTVQGLARMFGFDVVEEPSFTADAYTDIPAKIEAAVRSLNQHHLAFVHVKAPDIFAHDRDPQGKRDFIERLDEAIAPLLGSEIVIALAADHTTDSNTGFHTADPVPAMIARQNSGQVELALKFGEEACRSGNMPRQSSSQFLDRVLAEIGR